MRKINPSITLLIALLIVVFTTRITSGSSSTVFILNDDNGVAFITTWKSDNPGVSGDTQITIPTHPDETYNYNVFWENVNDENHNGTISNVTGDVTIEFGATGTFRVEITGTFPRIFFNKQGFFEEEGEWEKILLVNQWGDISWSTMESAFYGAVNLDVVAEDAPDLSNVESMRGMFRNASSFNGDIGHWDTSNVTDMQWVFQGASLFDQPIGDWNTDNVTNMFGMFSSASSFNQPIGDWETGKVTNMGFMFSGANEFNQPIGGWDTREVTNMISMFSALFSGQSSFNQPIGNWETGKVTNMDSMFSHAFVFNQPIGDWDTGSVTDMHSMFRNAREFNQPIGGWNTEKVTDMTSMFVGAEAFNQPINSWETGEVTSMGAMFSGAKAFNQPLDNWNTAKVTTMRSMFYGGAEESHAFNQNLGSWNIGSVTDMQFMFDNSAMSVSNYDATLAGWANGDNIPSGISLGAWRISYCDADSRNTLIDTYQWTFLGDALAENCDELPLFITTWKTDNPGGSGDNQIRIPMIGGGYDFIIDWGDGSDETYSNDPTEDVQHSLTHTYSDPGTYTVSISGDFPRIYFINADDREKILTVEQWGDIQWASMERAFNGAVNLNITATDAPDLTAVSSMRQIFNLASSLNADLDNWDTSTITDMYMAFRRAVQFNGNIAGWQTGNVTDMANMFIEAENFNGDISGWDVGQVATMAGMFRDAKAFNGDISGWNTETVANMNNMFRGASDFNRDIGQWATGAVVDMSNMFQNASSFNQDLTLWCVDSIASEPSNFSANSPLAEENKPVWGTCPGVTSIEAKAIPVAFSLEQNYPNPFNPSTVIGYQLPVNSEVSIEVYNLLGRRVATLVNERKPAGHHNVTFDASGLSSGVYVYRIRAGEFVKTRKMMLVK